MTSVTYSFVSLRVIDQLPMVRIIIIPLLFFPVFISCDEWNHLEVEARRCFRNCLTQVVTDLNRNCTPDFTDNFYHCICPNEELYSSFENCAKDRNSTKVLDKDVTKQAFQRGASNYMCNFTFKKFCMDEMPRCQYYAKKQIRKPGYHERSYPEHYEPCQHPLLMKEDGSLKQLQDLDKKEHEKKKKLDEAKKVKTTAAPKQNSKHKPKVKPKARAKEKNLTSYDLTWMSKICNVNCLDEAAVWTKPECVGKKLASDDYYHCVCPSEEFLNKFNECAERYGNEKKNDKIPSDARDDFDIDKDGAEFWKELCTNGKRTELFCMKSMPDCKFMKRHSPQPYPESRRKATGLSNYQVPDPGYWRPPKEGAKISDKTWSYSECKHPYVMREMGEVSHLAKYRKRH